MELANRLLPDYPDALDSTPGRLLYLSRIADGRDRRNMDSAAIAGRVAQADQKGWKAFFKDR